MNVLVIGDSWAARDIEDVSWVSLLRNKVGNLTCIAKGATSLFYSYSNLMGVEDLRDYYDFVIMIITSPGRLYFPDDPQINSYDSAKIRLDDKDPKTRIRANAALQYYEHLRYLEFDMFLHRVLIEKIQQRLEVIPHFLQPMTYEGGKILRTSSNFCLVDIKDKQLESIPINQRHRVHTPNKENLINHMSPSNNRVLCDYFYDIITKGSSSITIDDFNKLEDPIDQWFPDHRDNRLPSWVSVF